MRKYVIGFLMGIFIATVGTAYADEGLEKIEAYLRPTLPITLDGNPLKMESSPVMVDGSTYLKLRDVAAVTGLEVNWNDTTQTVELNSKGEIVVESAPQAIAAPEKTVQERIDELKKELANEKANLENNKMMKEVNEKIKGMPGARDESVNKTIDMFQGYIVESEARIAEYEAELAELQKQ